MHDTHEIKSCCSLRWLCRSNDKVKKCARAQRAEEKKKNGGEKEEKKRKDEEEEEASFQCFAFVAHATVTKFRKRS